MGMQSSCQGTVVRPVSCLKGSREAGPGAGVADITQKSQMAPLPRLGNAPPPPRPGLTGVTREARESVQEARSAPSYVMHALQPGTRGVYRRTDTRNQQDLREDSPAERHQLRQGSCCLMTKAKGKQSRDAGGAQSVERPTSARVRISPSVSSSPGSGSVLMARSLEPASDSVSPSLCPSPTCALSLSPSLSLKNK